LQDCDARDVKLPLRIGARTLGHVRRRLARVRIGLEAALTDVVPALPALETGADGYLVNGLPDVWVEKVCGTGLRSWVRQSYRRHYAPLSGTHDDYLAGFSAKTRSTLKRKLRKFADAAGGLDVRCYRTPEEVEAFHGLARSVSALTYQERLLGAGLPEGETARAELAQLAAADLVRGFVLFAAGRPVAYLHAPAEGETLLYQHLGYDPAFASLSPGTVLQMEAMRMLIEEGRFAWFDFTEGEGQHKALFGRGEIASVDLMLLRPTLSNRIAGHGLARFDRSVGLARTAAARLGVERLARRLAR